MRRIPWHAWMLLGLSLLATLTGTLQVNREVESRALVRFASACDRVVLHVRERLDAYALVLRGGAGLLGGSEFVSRAEWRAYFETLDPTLSIPGVQGFGFAESIAPGELAAHVARMRAAGHPEYRVWPAGERAAYSSVVYLEPFTGANRRAFGYDMYSEPVRREAMDRARASARSRNAAQRWSAGPTAPTGCTT